MLTPISACAYDAPMNTHTDTDTAVKARREAATAAFKVKAHGLYHKVNGDDAPCHMCANVPQGTRGFTI
jgi:hypothetical protein